MKFKALPPEKVIKTLEALGFEKIRQRGSHVFMRHPDGRATVVPVHKGEEVGRGLLLQIIKDTKLTKEEFLGEIRIKKAAINEAPKKYVKRTRRSEVLKLFGNNPYDASYDPKKHRSR